MAVEIRYTGGPSNQFAAVSIGGAMSDYQVPDAELQNMFDDVNRVEIITGRIDYRCFCIYNNSTDKYYRTFLKSFVVPTYNEIEVAIELGDSAQVLANESEDPVGLTFFKMTDFESFRAAIGELEAYTKIFVWFKRKVVQGQNGVLTLSFIVDGTANALTITQDFNTTESAIDNVRYAPHTGPYLTDESYVGEALTS